jgi:beta-aspartyl-peptidase (threonine type)
MLKKLLGAAWMLVLCACSGGGGDGPANAGAAAKGHVAWALAIHGGAGTIPKDMPAERVAGYRGGLERALRVGTSILEEGGTSLDAVEQVIRMLEDDPHFNAGKGAVFNHDGEHELDASIMDGETLACGAVARVATVKNPISLARLVMTRTPHVLLAGDGAERFAAAQGIDPVEQGYFFTEQRRRQYRKALAAAGERSSGGGTVGAVALDRAGNLAAGTSTGGLTNKMFGRVGDSPIVGAGTYAQNGACAVSGTGKGEEFIRHGVARSIAFLVEHQGLTVHDAAGRVIHEVLAPGDGGVIVLGQNGDLAMVFNTAGMYRGAADASGRFEVSIWE